MNMDDYAAHDALGLAGWTCLVGHKPTRGLVSKGPQASDATAP